MAGSTRVYQFFQYDWNRSTNPEKTLSPEFQFKVFLPSWRKLRIGRFTSIWLYWFWFLFSSRKFRIYYFMEGERVVHLSHVISRNPKFPFLGPDDFEIGPCWTDPEFRGLGLYPITLGRIAEDLKDKVERLVIFAEEDNSGSLKGISKAGFKLIGTGEKRGILGRYVLKREMGE